MRVLGLFRFVGFVFFSFLSFYFFEEFRASEVLAGVNRAQTEYVKEFRSSHWRCPYCKKTSQPYFLFLAFGERPDVVKCDCGKHCLVKNLFHEQFHSVVRYELNKNGKLSKSEKMSFSSLYGQQAHEALGKSDSSSFKIAVFKAYAVSLEFFDSNLLSDLLGWKSRFEQEKFFNTIYRYFKVNNSTRVCFDSEIWQEFLSSLTAFDGEKFQSVNDYQSLKTVVEAYTCQMSLADS